MDKKEQMRDVAKAIESAFEKWAFSQPELPEVNFSVSTDHLLGKVTAEVIFRDDSEEPSVVEGVRIGAAFKYPIRVLVSLPGQEPRDQYVDGDEGIREIVGEDVTDMLLEPEPMIAFVRKHDKSTAPGDEAPIVIAGYAPSGIGLKAYSLTDEGVRVAKEALGKLTPNAIRVGKHSYEDTPESRAEAKAISLQKTSAEDVADILANVTERFTEWRKRFGFSNLWSFDTGRSRVVLNVPTAEKHIAMCDGGFRFVTHEPSGGVGVTGKVRSDLLSMMKEVEAEALLSAKATFELLSCRKDAKSASFAGGDVNDGRR